MNTQNANQDTTDKAVNYFDDRLTKAQTIRNIGGMFWSWIMVLASWGVVGLFVMSFDMSYK